MATRTVHIQRAEAADLTRIANTLAGAFFDDPVFRWGLPDDERRRKALPGIFSVFTAAFAPLQGVSASLSQPPLRQYTMTLLR